MEYYFVVNAKNYDTSIGKNSLNLAKIFNDLQKKMKKTQILFCVNPADLVYITSKIKDLKIGLLLQNFDTSTFGSSTGLTHFKLIKDYGAKGSLINHSENRLKIDSIYENNLILKKNKMISIICANNVPIAKALSTLKPDFIAIEPPELIGGNVSVSKSNPQIIKEGIKVTNDNLLVGAGIKNAMDVRIAIELGAKGVLVASGVCKADDPRKATIDLLKGFGELNEI